MSQKRFFALRKTCYTGITMGEKKPKRGRPKLPKGDRRTVEVHFRARKDEADRMRKSAEEEGLRISDWLRKVANNAICVYKDV